MKNKSLSSRSKLFKGILNLVCRGEVPEPFTVSLVSSILGPSESFLSKHSIDRNDPNKKATGNPYFIRVVRGKYKINPKFKKCP